MKKLKQAKEVYNSIKTPDELQYRVRYVIENKDAEKNMNRNFKILATITSLCLLFIVLINTNRTFAKKIAEIPIFSSIFTVKQVKKTTEQEVIDVKIPAIASLSDKNFEEKVNTEIMSKIEAIINQNQEEAKIVKEEYEIYAKENHIKAKFQPIKYTIDYEIKSNRDDILSFEIIQTQESESMHYFYTESYMYNIDLKNNKELTLKDILGDNYKEIANKEITKQIEKMGKEENNLFFERDDQEYVTEYADDPAVIKDYQFYINPRGNLVITFDRYSIAPGYMGKLEFEIKLD